MIDDHINQPARLYARQIPPVWHYPQNEQSPWPRAPRKHTISENWITPRCHNNLEAGLTATISNNICYSLQMITHNQLLRITDTALSSLITLTRFFKLHSTYDLYLETELWACSQYIDMYINEHTLKFIILSGEDQIGQTGMERRSSTSLTPRIVGSERR